MVLTPVVHTLGSDIRLKVNTDTGFIIIWCTIALDTLHRGPGLIKNSHLLTIALKDEGSSSLDEEGTTYTKKWRSFVRRNGNK